LSVIGEMDINHTCKESEEASASTQDDFLFYKYDDQWVMSISGGGITGKVICCPFCGAKLD
jgi:hypothetical protein